MNLPSHPLSEQSTNRSIGVRPERSTSRRVSKLAWAALAFGLPAASLAEVFAEVPCYHPQLNLEFPLYGDVNGSGHVNVADTMCIILTSLWSLNPGEDTPPCVADDIWYADLTCDSAIDVADATLCVKLTLAMGIGSQLDPEGRGCVSACVPTCAPCPAGVYCEAPSDCESGVCENSLCEASGCADGVLNGSETDIDCGGACGACADGAGCSVGGDCVSGVCSGGTCIEPGCADGVKNGSETDVDCGGGCSGCEVGGSCLVDADCGGAYEGPFGECGAFDGICGEVGSNEREVHSPRCNQNTCEVDIALQSQSCERNTDGVTCGEPVAGPWGDCGGFGSVCDESGQRQRAVTEFSCDGGDCSSIQGEEAEACFRDTAGQACGPSGCDPWGSCTYPAVCATTGQRERQCADPLCAGGECVSQPFAEQESCERVTDGQQCAAPLPGPWGTCSYPSTCATVGERSRPVVLSSCMNEGCEPEFATETESCSRDTSGQACATTACGPWSGCVWANDCANEGQRTRVCQAYQCAAGSCEPVPYEEVEACNRNTNGVVCAAPQFGPWSQCTLADQCDAVGTRTRNATTFSCESGACGSVLSSETETCAPSQPLHPPVVSTHPAAATVCAGASPSFSVAATGSGLSYQWQMSTNGGSTWANLEELAPYQGTNATSLAISGAPAGLSGRQYRVVISGTCGTATSNAAALTVNTPPTAVSASGNPNPICAGNSLNLAGSAVGASSWSWSGPGGFTAAIQNPTRNSITTGHAGTYTVTATNSCGSTSATVDVAVNTPPTGVSASASPNPICAGATLNLSATGSGATSWSWAGPGGFTAATQNPARGSITTGHAGEYTVTATNLCGSTTANVNVAVNTPPTAVSASANPNPICAGSTLNLTGAATGATSWSWSGPGGFAASAQNPTRTNTTTAHAGTYTVTATNSCGETTASTSAVVVNSAPSITSQPSSHTICSGANASFSVGASGTGLVYQWQISTNNGSTWSNLNNSAPYSGVSTTSLSITGATAGLSGNQYRAVISGNCTPGATSNAATLTVNTAPSITSQPSSSAICSGANTGFSVSASGTGLSYQWQVSTNGGGTWTNLSNSAPYSGATTAALSITAASAGLSGNQYRAVVSGTCTPAANSSEATLTVNTAPTAVSASASPNPICAGSTLNLTGAATGATSWSWSGPGSFSSTAQNPTRSSITTGHAGTYTVTATNSCGSTSGTVNVTVNTTPTAVSASASPNPICAGGTLNFTGAATGATSWSWSGPGSFSSTAQNPTRASITTAHAGTYTVTATNSCGSTSATVNVSVNTAPTAVSASASPNPICAGSTLNLTGAATGATSWSWSGPGSFSSTAQNPTRSSIATGHAGTYTVTATNSCGSTSASVNVSVNTAPTAVSASASPNPICAGGTLNLTGAATGAASWSWSGPGSFSSTAQNPTRASITTAHAGTYTVTATNSCGSTSETVNVTVNSAPTISSQPPNRTICAGANTTFGVSASGTSLTYQWQLSTNGGSTWSNLSNSAPYSGATTATLTITGASAGLNNYRYRAVVSGVCTPAATSNAGILTVNAAPSAVSASASPNPICAGATLSLSGAGTGASSWSWSGPSSFSASTQNTSRANVTTAHAGAYTLTATNTCGSTQASTASVSVTTCPATSCGAWGDCSYSSTCANSGTRSRSCTSYSCVNGACQANNYTETENCTRNTAGNTCGTTQTSNWSECFPNSDCDSNGSQSRTVTTYTCNAGNCQSNSTTQWQSCWAFTECAPCWAGFFGICYNGFCQNIICP